MAYPRGSPEPKTCTIREGLNVAGTVRVEKTGQRSLVRARGEFDIVNAEQLHKALAESCAAGVDVTLDLSEVEFMDAYTLRYVVRASTALHKGGYTLVVTGANRSVRRLFSVTALDELLDE